MPSQPTQPLAFQHTTDATNVTPFTDGQLSSGSHIPQVISENAFVFVTPNGTNGIDYANHVMVALYDGPDGKWMIANENSGLPMPLGVVFNVLVLPANTMGTLIHTADPANTWNSPFKTFSRIVHPFIDNTSPWQRNLIKLLVTQRVGGPFATHNDNAPQTGHSGGGLLATPVRWYIGNYGGKEDGSDLMPVTDTEKLGATFNVLASRNNKVPGLPGAYVYEHTAIPKNTKGHHTFLSRNIPPDALLFVTPFWGKGWGRTEGPHNVSAIAVKYNHEGSGTWSVYNANGKPIPMGSKFHVFVVRPTQP